MRPRISADYCKGGGKGGGASKSADPIALANAQTQSNISTAQTQAALNNINTFSPYGSSTYGSYTDPSTGQTRYNLNQTLAPPMQDLFNTQVSLAQALAGTAPWTNWSGQQIGIAGQNLLQNQAMAAGLAVPTNLNLSNVPTISGLTPGSFITNVTGGAGGQPLSQVQTGVASPTTPIQTAVNAPGTPVQTTVNADFPQLIQQAQDAAYKSQTQYLDPQFAEARSNLTQQLADQGIQPGTVAYDRAMGDLNRQQTQAYGNAQLQAVQAGNAQQQALFGQSLQAGQFTNQAQEQLYNQAVTSGQFQNQAQQQAFAQLLAGGQFANQAQQQLFGQGVQLADLYNQAVLGAANQNIQAGQYNLGVSQAAANQPISALQALTGAGAQMYQTGLGGMTEAMQGINLAPTWPISIPSMGGTPSTVAPTNVVGAQQAATQQNQLANLVRQQNLTGLGSLGSQVMLGSGGLGGLFGSSGLLGSMFNLGGGASDLASSFLIPGTSTALDTGASFGIGDLASMFL